MTGASAKPGKSDFLSANHAIPATAETISKRASLTDREPVSMRDPLDGTFQRSSNLAAPSRNWAGDSVRDILRDCERQGLLDELRHALGVATNNDHGAMRAVRDLVYELAGAKDRDLAVDALIYATGVAEFDLLSLRDYASKHGLSPEGFRQHVLAVQHRLNLPPRPMQHSDAD